MATASPLAAIPSSPTLTNPDMILPPMSHYDRDSPSPTITTATATSTTLTRMSSLGGGGPLGRRRSVLDKPGLGPRLPVVTARPSMPGSWQSEQDTQGSDITGSSLARRPSLSHVHSAGLGRRLSRAGSLRSSPTWRRTSSSSRERAGDASYSHSSNGSGGGRHGLLGSGSGSDIVRRTNLAERLNEEQEEEDDCGGRGDGTLSSPYTTTSGSTNADEKDTDTGDDGGDISTRAEEILANAKKRLTAMEGNLSRARSISLTRSPSSASTNSLGESAAARFSRRISKTNALGNSWASNGRLRQSSLGAVGSHLRVGSDTAGAPSQRISTGPPQRSMSALGHGAGGSPGLRTEWTDTSSSESFSNGLPRHLEPLQEDEIGLGADDFSSWTGPAVKRMASSSPLYQSPSSSTSTLSRARSSIALRDLQEGVQDLKGKVDHLRTQAKRESMHRQSLQRLKSPSPFTDAETWQDPRNRESKMSAVTAVKVTESTPPLDTGEFSGGNPEVEEPDSTTLSPKANNAFKSPTLTLRGQHDLEYGDSPLLPVHPRIRHIPPTPTTPYKHTSNASTDTNQTMETADSGPISPSLSDAFPAPPETTPSPPRSRSNSVARSRSSSVASQSSSIPAPPTSHEDNPDAFDYSRFLLDSAMGKFQPHHGGQAQRSSSPSASSITTTSTTRPRTNSIARLPSSASASASASAANRASTSTARRISLSPSTRSRASSISSVGSQGQTLAQRRASGRSNSSASLSSITIPDSGNERRSSSTSTLQRKRSNTTSAAATAVVRPVTPTRQLSTGSTSASSVASFATALERASSRLTIRSLSRSTLRNASVGGEKTMPTHRAGLESYGSATTASVVGSRNSSLASIASSVGSPGPLLSSSSPPPGDRRPTTMTTTTTTTSKQAPMSVGGGKVVMVNGTSSADHTPLLDEAMLLRSTPTSPVAEASLASNLSKATTAILSAVLAVSHAAVQEEDERHGAGAELKAGHGVRPVRTMGPKDEEMLGRVLEGVLEAAVGLIGRSRSSNNKNNDEEGQEGSKKVNGSMANHWRKGSYGGGAGTAQDQDQDEQELERQREIWRMRCEVARRALSEEKPGEGF